MKAGQPLVRARPGRRKVALEQAEAKLAQTVREVRALFATTAAAAKHRSTCASARGRARNRGPEPARSRSRAPAPCRAKNCTMPRDALTRARARRRSRASRSSRRNQALTDGTTVENHPDVLARRRAGARGVPRRRAHRAAGAGGRLRRQARGAARPARSAGHAADVDRPARPGLGRRQLQGSAAAQHAHRPAGEARRPTSTARRSVPRHASPASAPAPARPSRCCRRRTPPATGSRWCSACRCASRSTRSELAAHPLRVGLSMEAEVDVHEPGRQDARRRAAQPRAASADQRVRHARAPSADAEVQRDHRRQPRPRRGSAGSRAADAAPRVGRAPATSRTGRAPTAHATRTATAAQPTRPQRRRPPPAPAQRAGASRR